MAKKLVATGLSIDVENNGPTSANPALRRCDTVFESNMALNDGTSGQELLYKNLIAAILQCDTVTIEDNGVDDDVDDVDADDVDDLPMQTGNINDAANFSMQRETCFDDVQHQ